MGELEAVRLCAEAMGLSIEPYGLEARNANTKEPYWPLTNGEHGMALVEKFKADIFWSADEPDGDVGYWHCEIGPNTSTALHTRDRNLRRAIVHCVAKMQLAKGQP